MRVVAGELRGRRLIVPKGGATRPTADRVREALFSILGDVSDLRVLDLFAGSGALAIEALSRGATGAVLVESDRAAQATIARNLRDLDLGPDRARLVRRDALAWLAGADAGGPYDLVFCDPPYDAALALAAPLAREIPAHLSATALIVTESDKRTPLELPFPLARERTYGDTRIAVHRP